MNKPIFLSIIIIALTVRLYGINWDNGTHLHPDERMIVMTAGNINYNLSCLKKDLVNIQITNIQYLISNILSPNSRYRQVNSQYRQVNSQYRQVSNLSLQNLPSNCNLNPKFFAYGSFPIYLLKLTGATVAALTRNPIHAGYDGLPQIGRLLNIFFDLSTLILLGLIAKNLTNSKFEYRNSKQYLNPNVQMTKTFRILNFENLNLFRASNFGFRIFPYLAMFFYAFAVFPIQNVKFYTVDTLLTALTTLTIFLCLKFYQKPSLCHASLIAISLGLGLATKISAVLLAPTILLTLILSLYRRTGGASLLIPNIKYLISIILISSITFFFAEPFALLDFPTFKAQLLEQTRMQRDPFTFPFTLQYVNTAPYWYFVKNILLWGLGLPLGILALVGTIYFFFQLLKNLLFKANRQPIGVKSKSLVIPSVALPSGQSLILASFFLFYFLIIGNSAVKFMRYLLPLYPFFCLFAAYFFISISKKISPVLSILLVLSVLSVLFWPLAFLSIYSKPHTRIQASQWMVKNIPAAATLAHENWDDTLPLIPHSFTRRIELSTYTYEPNQQWDKFAEALSRSDYIIISSNRLYATLMRLTDCSDPQIKRHNRCYPKTAQFYRLLLNNQLQGFTKVADFTSYPQIGWCPAKNISAELNLWQPPLLLKNLFFKANRQPIGVKNKSLITHFCIQFRDEGADESFTVYDHPRVFIFQNTGFSSATFFSQIPFLPNP